MIVIPHWDLWTFIRITVHRNKREYSNIFEDLWIQDPNLLDTKEPKV